MVTFERRIRVLASVCFVSISGIALMFTEQKHFVICMAIMAFAVFASLGEELLVELKKLNEKK